jgi:hypothetical protein
MPAIHASLNDEDFVEFAIMARAKGTTRTALASEILVEAIRKQMKETPDEAEIKFNRQGLPLAQRLKTRVATATIAEGVPLVTQYERE